jgi:hypothetical protein
LIFQNSLFGFKKIFANIKAKRARTRAHPLVVVLPKILDDFKMWDNSKDKIPR